MNYRYNIGCSLANLKGIRDFVRNALIENQVPEIQVVRVGNRLLLAAPGEPTVEMGRRFEAAVRPELPKGVKEPVVVGLANDYMGYETTPEEYQMQHYEGGHTVFGLWSSLLIRNSFVALSHAMATGEPAPAPDRPAVLGGTDPGAFPSGDGEGARRGRQTLRHGLDRLERQSDGRRPAGRRAIRDARAAGRGAVDRERHGSRARVRLA